MSTQDEIESVFFQRPHVVILGAGASIAAVPRDRHDRLLPDMRGLVDLPDVNDLLEKAGGLVEGEDFEAVYARLRSDPEREVIANQIDEVVRAYFAEVEIPDEVTIYDHLLLSLREKDVVATFNWDPLIVQAEMRLRASGARDLPQVVYLHGNVSIAACLECETAGLVGDDCRICDCLLLPVPILYPVSEKDYKSDPFIAHAWHALRWGLKNGALATIFGYRAPVSDAAAIEEFRRAWGASDARKFEQFEIIARPGSDHEQLRSTWDDFIFSHHYDIEEDFFDSWIAKHPRRTGEAYFSQYIEAKFIDTNPVPRGSGLGETIDWYKSLIHFEEESSRPLSDSDEEPSR